MTVCRGVGSACVTAAQQAVARTGTRVGRNDPAKDSAGNASAFSYFQALSAALSPWAADSPVGRCRIGTLVRWREAPELPKAFKIGPMHPKARRLRIYHELQSS